VSRSREALFDIRKELALVLLEGQHIVATPLQYGLGKGTAAKKRVRGDDLAFQAEHLEDFQSRLRLVSAGRLSGGQRQAGFGRKDVDQVNRQGALASLVGAAQRFAVDREHAAQIQAVKFGECCDKASERLLEGCGIEHAKHVAEHIVARDTFLQRHKSAQQIYLAPTKIGHVRATRGPAQHRRQGNEENLQQRIRRIGRARIAQPPEILLEFAHLTPLANRESSSESCSQPLATGIQKPKAIPLLSRGGFGRERFRSSSGAVR